MSPAVGKCTVQCFVLICSRVQTNCNNVVLLVVQNYVAIEGTQGKVYERKLRRTKRYAPVLYVPTLYSLYLYVYDQQHFTRSAYLQRTKAQ